MKEIRFRAWEKDYKYMNYKVMVGNVWDEENYQWVNPKRVDYEFYPGWKHFDENSNIELMQYTGLKDKNGVEIYEGDIIRGPHDFGPGGFSVIAAPVKYHVIHGYQLHYFLLEQTEVIGNIYENPELLERDSDEL